MRRRLARGCAATLVAVLLSGCGNLFQDNGTHLAYALQSGAAKLRASSATELVVRYETLDSSSVPYYVEITPSIAAGQTSSIWSSYLVVSGKTPGGTSYHNRYVFVPQRLYLRKEHGGSTELVLRKEADRINVVELR
jgi:hypothetical protein